MKIGSIVIVFFLVGFCLQGVFAQEVPSESLDAGSNESVSDSSNDTGSDASTDFDNSSKGDMGTVSSSNDDSPSVIAVDETGSDVGSNDPEPSPDTVVSEDGQAEEVGSEDSPSFNEKEENPPSTESDWFANHKDDPIPVEPEPLVAEAPPVGNTGGSSVGTDKECEAKDSDDPTVVTDCGEDGLDDPHVDPVSTDGKENALSECEKKINASDGTPADCDDATDDGEGSNPAPLFTQANFSSETTGAILFAFNPLWNSSVNKSTTAPPAPVSEGSVPSESLGGTVDTTPAPAKGTAELGGETPPATPDNSIAGLITGANAPLIGLLALLVIGGVLYVRSRKV